jgi:hypothetical protein
MIDFIAGVAFGYFCRPVVAAIIKIISGAWAKFQKQGDNNESK